MSNQPSSSSPTPEPGKGHPIVRAGKAAFDVVAGAVHSRDGKWEDVRNFWSHEFPHRIEEEHHALRDTFAGIPAGTRAVPDPMIAELSTALITAGDHDMMQRYSTIFQSAVNNFPWQVFGENAITRQGEAETHLQNINTGIATPANAGTFNSFLRSLQAALQQHSRVTTDHDQVEALEHAQQELNRDLGFVLASDIWNGQRQWAATVTPPVQQVRTQAQEALDLVRDGIAVYPGYAIVYRPEQILRAVHTVQTSIQQAASSMPHHRADLPRNVRRVPWTNPEKQEHGYVVGAVGYSAERNREWTRRTLFAVLGGAGAWVASNVTLGETEEAKNKREAAEKEKREKDERERIPDLGAQPNLFEGTTNPAFEFRAARKDNVVLIKMGGGVVKEKSTIALRKEGGGKADWIVVTGAVQPHNGHHVVNIPQSLALLPAIEISCGSFDAEGKGHSSRFFRLPK